MMCDTCYCPSSTDAGCNTVKYRTVLDFQLNDVIRPDDCSFYFIKVYSVQMICLKATTPRTLLNAFNHKPLL